MTEYSDQPIPAVARLEQLLPGVVLETEVHRGDTAIRVPRERLLEVCRVLRNDEQTHFDYLIDVTAVDWDLREPRFDVVYHLFSIPLNHLLRVKVGVDDLEPVDSLTGIWDLADWGERETYDMFGINFVGHPDLRRILLPEDWEDGFPLRKDFPIGGYGIWAADNVPFR
jgi:NADH-quinone oxidoreductase subunit C